MSILNVEMMEKMNLYMVKYALDEEKGIRRLLQDKYLIAERRYKGDTAASDVLLDLELAIKSAYLTEKQRHVIHFLYGESQMTQTEVANKLRVSQKQISIHLRAAIKKITKVYKTWRYNEIEMLVVVDDMECTTV
ncbi:sigma factor-like helix-turn-helix DNA-binding protein [Longirhabdus pacifica]|uniref:sigma factor-like helix-turn-helix DNA-binding protein n=1 Tax=Longirhabdus pacifica TaxID=2305227 RepID=UPI00100903ED|nr:sigma factor-like helix-turn-helix DNA-binding protein [Longirhabdus pacifica]